MLRKIALIYCVFALIQMGFQFGEAIEYGVFIKVQPWISWGLNILGIVAVFAYGLRRNIFPKAFWLMVLISYISIRIYELFPYGLVPADTSLYLMLLVGLKYVYLVIPSLLCLCYFGLNRNAYDKNL